MLDVSQRENPRKETKMTVVINYTLYGLLITLHTVEIDYLTAHRQDIMSDDWCKIPERRPK